MLSGRGRGGRTVVQRAPRQKAPASRGRKKLCDRGQNCPYLHEHQHLSEFYHEESKGDTIKNSSGKNIAPPFQGHGQRLGGERSLANPSLRRELMIKSLEARLANSTVVNPSSSTKPESLNTPSPSVKRQKTKKNASPIDLTDE